MGLPPTPSQTVGPFFGFALPFEAGPEAARPDTPGAFRIEGQVLDGEGAPVPDALVELWRDDQFARCATDGEGAYRAVLRKPAPVPGANGAAQAASLNVTLFCRGLLRHLTTRMYFPDEEAANAADPVLNLVDPARRATLVAVDEGGGVLRFDIRIQGERETVFFAV